MILEKLRAKFNQKVFGNSASTIAPTTVIDDYINEAYQKFLIIVLPYYRWRVNGEISDTHILAGQKEYILPGDLLRVLEVRVNDVLLTDDQYTIFDKSIMLEDETLYEEDLEYGLALTYQDEYTALAETTDVPNIPTAFHPFLYKFASREYCEDFQIWDKFKTLDNWIDKEIPVIEDHYYLKTNKQVKMIPAVETNY